MSPRSGFSQCPLADGVRWGDAARSGPRGDRARASHAPLTIAVAPTPKEIAERVLYAPRFIEGLRIAMSHSVVAQRSLWDSSAPLRSAMAGRSRSSACMTPRLITVHGPTPGPNSGRRAEPGARREVE